MCPPSTPIDHLFLSFCCRASIWRAQVLCNSGSLTVIPTRKLPPTVENLALTKNNFPVIKSDAFAGLRFLKKLSLDGNNITTIKPFAFRGLPKIREISIQYTPLTTVAQFAFAGLQNITTILLSHNKIMRVEMNAFAGTSNVKLILLTNNPMMRLETSAFSGLTHVEHLILPSGLRLIEPDAFYGMDSVGLLKLAYMDLAELSPFTFRGLTNVAVLSLQESDLGVICANSFDGLSHVASLKLLSNKIDMIEELNLTASHHIKQLIFHGNHLLETPEPGAILLDGIQNVSVINNHFPCGCHVHTLLDSPLSNGSYQHGDFLSRNYCISPLDVNGRPMSDLDLDGIGRCQEQVTRENLDASAAVSLHRMTGGVSAGVALVLAVFIATHCSGLNGLPEIDDVDGEVVAIDGHSMVILAESVSRRRSQVVVERNR